MRWGVADADYFNEKEIKKKYREKIFIVIFISFIHAIIDAHAFAYYRRKVVCDLIVVCVHVCNTTQHIIQMICLIIHMLNVECRTKSHLTRKIECSEQFAFKCALNNFEPIFTTWFVVCVFYSSLISLFYSLKIFLVCNFCFYLAHPHSPRSCSVSQCE